KPAFPFQRQSERAFFAPVKTFVEPAGGLEGFAGAKHEGAAGKADEFRAVYKHKAKQPEVKRNGFIFSNPSGTAAADSPFVHVSQRRSDGIWIDGSVGIDKEETFAECSASAGVARGSDLTMIDVHHSRAVLQGDIR